MSSASPIDHTHPLRLVPLSDLEQIITQKIEAGAACIEKYKDIPQKIIKAGSSRQVQADPQPIHLLYGSEYLKIARLEAREAQKEIKAEVKNIQLAVHMYYIAPSNERETHIRATLEKQEGDLTVLFKQIQEASEKYTTEDFSPTLLDRTRKYLASKLVFTDTDADEKRDAEREADLQAQMRRLNSEESTEQPGDVVVGDKEEEADQ